MLPIVFDQDGLPMEGAMETGFGVPVLSIRQTCFQILLDGGPVDKVVAFSRPDRWVVRLQSDYRGQTVFNGRGAVQERLHGDVTLRKHAPCPLGVGQ